MGSRVLLPEGKVCQRQKVLTVIADTFANGLLVTVN